MRAKSVFVAGACIAWLTGPGAAPEAPIGRASLESAAPSLAAGNVSASFGTSAELRVGEHTASFRAVSLGRGDVRAELAAVASTLEGGEVRAERAPGVVEWWRSVASGLEHGVTIAERPAGEGELTLSLAVRGLGTQRLDDESVALTAPSGEAVATYAQLVVTDARGARLPARMRASDVGIEIGVDDAEAAYPVVIDPLVVAIEATLLGTSSNEGLGSAVSLSADGSRALVGVPTVGGLAGPGAARVFLRTGTAWTLEATLTAADGMSDDGLGLAVALSGDGLVALVGAPTDDTAAGSNAGSARVFVRTGTTWAPEATLLAPDGAMNDRFGCAAALTADGSRALVGVCGDDPMSSGLGGIVGGSARVFLRTGTTWSQEARLTAAIDSALGWSVALSEDGTRAIAGGPYETTAAGAQAGTARIFVRSGTTWSAEATLLPPAGEGSPADNFGWSVALTGDASRAIVGAPLDDLAGGGGEGTARVYRRAGTTWTHEATLTAPDATTFDQLGKAVGLSSDGSRAVIGVPNDDTSIPNVGSIRMFTRSGVTWTHDSSLIPSDSSSGFGGAVAVSGDGGRALVGEPYDSTTSLGNMGSARVITLRAMPGAACTSAAACVSGNCVDGVCCDTACTGGAADCQACSVAAGGAVDGVCGPLSAGFAPTITCRAAALGDLCDAPEVCSPTSTTCPADALYPATRECRAAVPGGCDVAESCTGTSATCPADAVRPTGTSCRGIAGVCDVEETCDGTSPNCPTDARLPNGTECRPSLGACDPYEACDGTSTACPANVLLPVGTVCGVGMGDCATPGACTGSSPTCPSPGARPSGTLCRTAVSACDQDDYCDGTSQVCQDDFAPATQNCGGAPSGVCDAQDHCTGTSGDCVPEFLVDVECRASVGACDLVEVCSGDSTECGPDQTSPAGTVCRASTETCDPAESCDGTGTTCPGDVMMCATDAGGSDGGGSGADGGGTTPTDAGSTDGGSTDGGSSVPTAVTGCSCRVPRGRAEAAADFGPLLLGLTLFVRRRRR